MKKAYIRFISLLLLMSLLSQTTALAADIQYNYPNDWSRNALVFAVENGIMKGNQQHDLEPKRATTRAEMAAILVRMLGLSGSANLSAYQDVSAKAWYYRELSAAVDGGIFNGLSATKMGPNASITREQTMTVLCRAFGLVPLNRTAYKAYTDSGKISSWATDSISALQERGLVKGYEDGSLKPRNTITRAEVAQLIYNLFDAIVDDPREIPQSGRVLYVGTGELPEDLLLDGTLILGPQYTGAIANWNISDDLVLRCSGNYSLSGVTAKDIVCAAPNTTISGAPQTQKLITLAENISLDSPASLIVAGGSTTVSGTCDAAEVRSGQLTVEGMVDSIVISGGSVVLNGMAKDVQITGTGVSLTGSGYAGTITNTGKNSTIRVHYGTISDQERHGLQGVSVSLSKPEKVTEPTSLTLTATFQGGTFTGPDTTDGKLICTLQWLQNGKVVSENKKFALYDGVVVSYPFTISSEDTAKLGVKLVNGTEILQRSCQVATDFYQWDFSHALSTVQTLKIDVTLGQAATLYSDSSFSTSLRTLPKGTVVYLLYNNVAGKLQVKTADGVTGWISDAGTSITKKKVTHSEQDYSLGTKEGFVNQNGYSSSTSYLIWVSCYTQRVNIYQGSKGKWKLIRSCLVSTGDNDTPTPIGTYSTYYHTDKWKYDDFYVDTITGFHGGHAFHSILYAYDGSIYNDRVGVSLSHGCVRMQPADVKFVYSLPLSTRVVVY